MVTQTLKEFKKLNLPIFKKLEKLYYNKANDEDIVFIETNIRDYEYCAIGSLRQKFGLPANNNPNSYNCDKCKDLAINFPTIYEELQSLYEEIDYSEGIEKTILELRKLPEKKQKYESILLDTKRHFRMIHNKELI